MGIDEHWMRHALHLADRAARQNEVPVGAVITQENSLLAEGWNQPIQTHDPSAHAEIIALRRAGQILGNYRLLDTTLYVTLEPCLMCVSAMIHARITRLVFGAPDPKTGAVMSVFNILDSMHLNHRISYESGILRHDCAQQLRDFFQKRRKQGNLQDIEHLTFCGLNNS